MIKTGSVYELRPDTPHVGLRLLVTRYWPRGVRKDRIDLWLKELGTEPDLITAWKSKGIGWEEFSRGYIKGLEGVEATEALTTLRSIINKAGSDGVTLLCTCKEGEMCHRELLKGLVEGP